MLEGKQEEHCAALTLKKNQMRLFLICWGPGIGRYGEIPFCDTIISPKHTFKMGRIYRDTTTTTQCFLNYELWASSKVVKKKHVDNASPPPMPLFSRKMKIGVTGCTNRPPQYFFHPKLTNNYHVLRQQYTYCSNIQV